VSFNSQHVCSIQFADNGDFLLFKRQLFKEISAHITWDKQRLLQHTLHYYISAHITWEALSAIDSVGVGVQSNTGILVGLRSSSTAL
jgi:hypothetical protein